MSLLSLSGAAEVRWSAVADHELECLVHLDVPGSLFAGLPDADTPAIRSTAKNVSDLTYRKLRAFLCDLGSLRDRGIGPRELVGVVLPNGPELAVALMAFMAQCVAAPLEPTLTGRELVLALQQLDVKNAIASQKGFARKRIVAACEETGCRLHSIRSPDSSSVDHKIAGLFHWAEEGNGELSSHSLSIDNFLPAQDICLVLRTSGTTSKPKKVPLTFAGLYTGAVCMGRGMDLCPDDVCLNVMPYSHIGGISCSLFATLFAGGGTVICAPVFDASTFLAWLEQLKPTWYYAVPTIHKALCLCAKAQSSTPQHCLRLIRSGAAHLSHEHAKELRAIFKCQVLPTYSMTECMPITQPPVDYDLGKPGSVGVPVVSSMCIVSNESIVACGSIGEVCIMGPVLTTGYIDDVSANDACFFRKAGSGGHCCWFRTGDVGYLDKDGFLFLTGRNKEMIKRGGEQISPYEVEEAFLAHPGVEVAVVFGVPNHFWGEEVAAAVVANADEFEGRDAASELYQFLCTVLTDSKVPRQFVFLESTDMLPKTHTGKYLRIGLASHFGVQPVDLAAANRWVMPELPKKRVVKPCKTIAIASVLVAFGIGLLLRSKSGRV